MRDSSVLSVAHTLGITSDGLLDSITEGRRKGLASFTHSNNTLSLARRRAFEEDMPQVIPSSRTYSIDFAKMAELPFLGRATASFHL